MKYILLDTNMLIYREGETPLSSNTHELLRLLMDSDEYKACIHPFSLVELKKHKNEEEKAVILSKITAYPMIENPPIPDIMFLNNCGIENGEHDHIDNCLLYCVMKDCIDYFITNDNKLLKKAKRMKLNHRVLSIQDAILLLEKEDSTVSAVPLSFIKEEYLYNIDLNNSFFDSLKEDYKAFECWYKNKSRKQAKAYITYTDSEDKNIGAFLLLKIEDENEQYSSFEIPFMPGRRVKVSTFKVSDNGKSLGEAFIKIMVEYALKNNLNELYVTTFPKHERLISLLKEYGFKEYTKKETATNDGYAKELVLHKIINSNCTSYPIIQVISQDIFIVPIVHEYFQMLFPEGNEQLQLSLPFVNGMASYSNAIKKVYISKSKIKMVKSGDVLLFYASKIKKEFYCAGIVDEVYRAKEIESFDIFKKLVSRRTVYEDNYLKRVYENNDLVILFKYYTNLKKPISLKEAIEANIILASPQTIQSLSKEKFKRIVELSGSEALISI